VQEPGYDGVSQRPIFIGILRIFPDAARQPFEGSDRAAEAWSSGTRKASPEVRTMQRDRRISGAVDFTRLAETPFQSMNSASRRGCWA